MKQKHSNFPTRLQLAGLGGGVYHNLYMDHMLAQTDSLVHAVVITYNRSELLLKNLVALASQTILPGMVHVIDHGSTDQTHQVLADRGVIKLDEPLDQGQDFRTVGQWNNLEIRYLRVSENNGSSAGFGLGLNEALTYDPTWLWLMDDDTEPQSDCLEQLMLQSSAWDFLNAVPVNIDNPEELAFRLKGDLGRFTHVAQLDACPAATMNHEAKPFIGTLLRSDMVRDVGVPCKQFYTCGDEVEYRLRCEKSGYRVGSALKARCHHPKKKYEYRKRWWRLGKTSYLLYPDYKQFCHYRNYYYIYATHEPHKLKKWMRGLLFDMILTADIRSLRLFRQSLHDVKTEQWTGPQAFEAPKKKSQ